MLGGLSNFTDGHVSWQCHTVKQNVSAYKLLLYSFQWRHQFNIIIYLSQVILIQPHSFLTCMQGIVVVTCYLSLNDLWPHLAPCVTGTDVLAGVAEYCTARITNLHLCVTQRWSLEREPW